MSLSRSARAQRSQRRIELAQSGLVRMGQHRAKSGANPTELRAQLESEDVSAHRNLGCPLYDACLDHVVLVDWPSWSCRKCVWQDAGSLERAEDAPRRDAFD